MTTIGSLFSGIGGLELGLEWAGLGPTLWQVETSEVCRGVLARHWPGAKRHEDVRSVGASTLAPVDLICGGFPCQDISSAGKRAGLAGARSGLWYEFARIVAECRPRWVVVENVKSGAAKWVDAVRGELGRLGYASLPVPIAASDCGAPHERARVFIVACRPAIDVTADADAQERPAVQARLKRPGLSSPVAARVRAVAAHADGIGRGAGRTGRSARGRSRPTDEASLRRSVADADRARQPQPRRPEREVGRWPCDADRIWTAEPDVVRVAHGLPGRVDRERALGNSVVPQCAQVVGQVIRQLMENV